MRSIDLLEAVGEAKELYLLEAITAWNHPVQGKKGSMTLKKVVLIAAVIALLTCLLGCAIAMLRLQDQKIGEDVFTRYYDENWQEIEPTEVTRDVVAIRGVKDSPNYSATMEWYEFIKDYPSILEFDFVDQSLENYQVYEWIYGCYSQEMVDKVNEIAQKYDLQLLNQDTTVQRWQTEILFEALGIENVCHEEKTSKLTDGSGNFYAEGNFQYSFEFKLPKEEGVWPHWVWATMCYSKDGYFHPITMTMDMESYEQWDYTTADGVDVLIAQRKNGAILIAQTNNGLFWVNLDTSAVTEGTESPTKQDIEQMAEVIDFTIAPKTPENMENIQKRLEESNAAHEAEMQQKVEKYGDYGAYLKDTYKRVMEDVYYAIYDLNNDGIDDLLLGSEDSTFSTVKTMHNGAVVDLYLGEKCWLCEDGTIVNLTKYNFRKTYYSFRLGAYDPNGNNVELLERIEHDRRKDTWVNKEDNLLTAGEAEQIIAGYTHKELPVMPLMEYPLDDTGSTLEEYILSNTLSKPVSEKERMAIYSQQIQHNQETAYIPATHYILMDITGDGVEDLLLTDNGDYIGDAFTVKNGELDTLFFWSGYYLCENNILEDSSSSYQHERYSYSSVDDSGWHTLNTLIYDKEGGKWYHDADGDNYYELEITEEEYKEILTSYRRVPLNWTPIDEFPYV